MAHRTLTVLASSNDSLSTASGAALNSKEREGAPADRFSRATTRFGNENLISFTVVALGEASADINAVRELAAYASARFSYYELVLVAAAPSFEWKEGLSRLLGSVENARLVIIERTMGYEELSAVALRFAIGDYVIGLSPGEIGDAEVDRLIAELENGNHDVVKMFYHPSVVPFRERVTAGLISSLISLTTGKRIQTFRARAFGVSRSAISRLMKVGSTQRFFHFLDLSGVIAESHLQIQTAPPRRFLSRFGEKAKLTADLVSLAAERLIRSFALACFILTLVSIAVVIAAFVIWLFKKDIASGWTSLTMVFSGLFAANFGVFSAVCLGLLQLIRQSSPDTIDSITTELSSGDFFRNDDRINVEIDDARGRASASPSSNDSYVDRALNAQDTTSSDSGDSV